MRQPILMGSDFKEIRRIHATGCSLVKNITPPASVQFTCPVEEAPRMGEWLRIFSPEGDEGIFRITNTSANYGQDGGKCTVYAEHAITSLGDSYIYKSYDIDSKTATQALTTILGKQHSKSWQLGRCDVPTGSSYRLSYTLSKQTVLEAVVQLLKAYHGRYMLTYDFTTTPWTVNFVATESTASCECRLSRNLQSAEVRVDRSQMANRLYCPEWLEDGEMPDPPKTVQDDDSIATWGVVSAEYNDGSATDNKTVLANARYYLDQVKEPVISIRLDAYELSQATGVSQDEFGIGKLCRIAIPLYDYTASERIIGISYDDMYEDPGRVQLTLANKVESASTGLAKLTEDASGSRGGRGRGGGSSKKAEIAESRSLTAQKNISLIITEDGKVSKASIVLALNDADQTTSATIKADMINLNGYVKASQLEAVDAKITNLVSGVTTVSQLKVSTMNIGGHSFSGAKLIKAVDGNSYWCLATSG